MSPIDFGVLFFNADDDEISGNYAMHAKKSVCCVTLIAPAFHRGLALKFRPHARRRRQDFGARQVLACGGGEPFAR